jgi:hypothetical protein
LTDNHNNIGELPHGVIYPPSFYSPSVKYRYSFHHLILRKILGALRDDEFLHHMADSRVSQEANIKLDTVSLDKEISCLFQGREDLGIGGKIILKWSLKKQGSVVCTEFIWLSAWTSSDLL